MLVVGLVLAALLFIVVSSLRAGDEAGGRSDADGAFIAGIKEGAVELGSGFELGRRLELAEGRDPALRRVARGIMRVQTREITKMRRWRERWYGPA